LIGVGDVVGAGLGRFAQAVKVTMMATNNMNVDSVRNGGGCLEWHGHTSLLVQVHERTTFVPAPEQQVNVHIHLIVVSPIFSCAQGEPAC
jgi:hypothetical protein